MKKRKKLLVLLLACVLCFPALPTYAMTADGYYEEGDTISVIPQPRLSGGNANFFGLADDMSMIIGYGYCCENQKASWARYEGRDSQIVMWDNHLARKAIYYGYGSPGYVPSGNGAAYDADSVTYTVGYLNNNTANESRALEYIERIKDLEDPLKLGFQTYIALIPDDPDTDYQNVAFLTYYNAKGYFAIYKTSTHPEIKDIDYESTATFGIYSDKECTNLVGNYYYNDARSAYDYEIWRGTYYVKELIAPDGFIKSEVVYEVTIKEGVENYLTVPNTPEDVGTGEAYIKKVSSDPEMTNDSDCYTFLGAKFGFYSDEGCTELVETLEITDNMLETEDGSILIDFPTDENGREYGYTNVVRVGIGTYYIKEIEAPKGYVLSDEVKQIVVEEGKTTVVEFANDPIMAEFDPYDILLKKINAFGEINPEGMMSLEGALFQLDFYEGLTYESLDMMYEEWYDSDGNVKYIPSWRGNRQWKLKTDEDGYCTLSEKYKVEGDDFCLSPISGLPSLPIGLLVIREFSAPNGYKVYEDPIPVEIKIDDNDGTQVVYNEPTVPEVPESTLKITKNGRDMYGYSFLIGESVEFTHEKPDGTKEVITSEFHTFSYEDGYDDVTENYAVLSNLDEGKHVVYESKPPKGFGINPNKIEFTYTHENGIVFTNQDSLDETVEITSEGSIYLEETDSFSTVDEIIVYDDMANSFDLVINKSDVMSGELLDGAEFTLYSDEELAIEVGKAETENGFLVFEDLEILNEEGTLLYYLKETKPPDGYTSMVNPDTGEPFVYGILFDYEEYYDEETYESTYLYYAYVFNRDGTEDYSPDTEGGGYGGPFGSIKNATLNYDDNNELVLTLDITNEKIIILPDTGSSLTILIVAIGILLMTLSVLYIKMKRNKLKEEFKMNKKLVSCLLALSLMVTSAFTVLLGTASVADAADTVAGEVTLGEGIGKITIQGNDGQTLVGKKFNVYPILSSEEADDKSSIYYTVNASYSHVLYDTIEEVSGTRPTNDHEVLYYISELNSSDFRYFVEDLRDAIVAANVDSSEYFTINATSATSANSIVLTGVEEGYYVVDEVSDVQGTHSASSLCMVNTASSEITIDIKSDYPSVTKKIEEDDNNIGWNDIADYEIGQTVPYKFTSNVPDMNGYATYYYAWHDVMDEALTFDKDSVEIVISNGTKDYTLTAQEFVVTENVDSETFKAEIADLKAIVDREFAAIDDETGKQVYDQTVTVTYNATLNDKAAVDTGRPGFENDVRLEFSNDPDSTGAGSTGLTIWDTVVCFTYKLDVLKTNEKNAVLENAKFHLYSDEECVQEVFVKASENGYIVINEDSVTADTESVDIVSDAEGKFAIVGLDGGTYYLKETDAPKGYKGLTDPIKLTVTPTFTTERQSYVKGDGATAKTLVDLQISAFIKDFFNGAFHEETLTLETDLETGSGNLTVINYTGGKLPITGSSAMIVMLGVGAAAMVGSVVYSKRKEKNEE